MVNEFGMMEEDETNPTDASPVIGNISAPDDLDMQGCDEYSSDDEGMDGKGHSEGTVGAMSDSLAVSGSPPKLINTPPTMMNPRKPRTIRRARSSWSPEIVTPVARVVPPVIPRSKGAVVPTSSNWPGTSPKFDGGLEDGRHIAGLAHPQLKLGRKLKPMSDMSSGQDAVKLQRSRSLHDLDFMEVPAFAYTCHNALLRP